MEKPNALTYFRGEYGYNCAQAVLKAFAPSVGLDESCMDRFSQFGGGRAQAANAARWSPRRRFSLTLLRSRMLRRRLSRLPEAPCAAIFAEAGPCLVSGAYKARRRRSSCNYRIAVLFSARKSEFRL